MADCYSHFLQDDASALSHPDNLLGQLVPLTNLPKVQEDLNTFFVPSLAALPASSVDRPIKKVKTKNVKKSKSVAEVEKLPEWMATFDSGSESDTESAKNAKRPRTRTSQLSIHASIHSVAAHQTVYTALWESVLSSLPLDERWTQRIVTGLHGERGMLSNMRAERRIGVADWLGSLVDRGGANAMLAMNGLYILMTQFNLCVPSLSW